MSWVANTSDSKHALVTRIELLWEHWFNIIFKSHPSFSQGHLLKLEILTLEILIRLLAIELRLRVVVLHYFWDVSELILREIFGVPWWIRFRHLVLIILLLLLSSFAGLLLRLVSLGIAVGLAAIHQPNLLDLHVLWGDHPLVVCLGLRLELLLLLLSLLSA